MASLLAKPFKVQQFKVQRIRKEQVYVSALFAFFTLNLEPLNVELIP